jgi:O-antigen/teichoic acid export membrane protein
MTELHSADDIYQDNLEVIPENKEEPPDSGKNANPSLVKEAISGLNWQFLSTVLQILLSMSIGIVLARLLTPDDFGIVGYILVFVGFSKTIAEAGISPALIQTLKLTKSYLGLGLIISFLIAVLTILILWLLAPILVSGVSISILRILSCIFLINVPSVISESLLRRSIKFFPIFIADAVSYSMGYGLVSIILALTNHGVWSLVIGIMVQTVIRSVLLCFMAPYKFSLLFTKTELFSIVRFSTGITLTKVTNYGANNLDYFVTGTFLGSEALGFYQRSFQLVTQTILNITGVLTNVLFPVFSKIQTDIDRSRRMYLLSVKTTSLVVFPITILISLTSHEIISILYGSKWAGSIASLSILSINALFISILTLGDSLARARGLVYHQFRRHFVYAIMVFTFAFLGKRFNIEGVSIGVTFASFFMYLFMAKLSIDEIKASWFDFFVAQLPGCVIASIMGLVTFSLGQVANHYIKSDIPILLLKLILAGIAVIITLYFLPKSWLGEAPRYIFDYLSSKFPGIKRFSSKVYRPEGAK